MAWWMIATALAGGAPVQEAMPGMAMKPAAACPATPAPLPADYAGWRIMARTKAGAGPASAALLTIAASAEAILLPTPQVTYAVAMKHMGTSASFGGNLSFIVPHPGRYRISLAAPAWIDVIENKTALTSVAHGHGPDCSGIRKIVDFNLGAGDHLLQIAANDGPVLGVMVTLVEPSTD